jgi:hypothetical protein
VLSGICTARTPPCGKAFQQPRQHRRMVRHPLKHRVAEQEIGALRRAPLARLPQHVGRRIDPNHLGIGESLD